MFREGEIRKKDTPGERKQVKGQRNRKLALGAEPAPSPKELADEGNEDEEEDGSGVLLGVGDVPVLGENERNGRRGDGWEPMNTKKSLSC